MKILKFIGLTLTAICLTLNLSACSNDDDDSTGSGGSVGVGRKLSSFKMEEENRDCQILYDAQSRIISVEEMVPSWLSSLTIEYSEGNITVTEYDNGEYFGVTECTLNSDGLIVKSSEKTDVDAITRTYSYDANKQLTQINQSMTSYGQRSQDNYSLTWSNGNLVKINRQDYNQYSDSPDETVYSYEYNTTPSSSCLITYFDGLLLDGFNFNLMWLANTGYFGKLPQNLVSKRQSGEETCNISYDYDDKGYVSTIHWVANDEEAETINLQWE